LQIYLVEEDASYRKKRKMMGGNRSKKWTEGWIEFEDKKIAKGVCSASH
jgi:ESF2/ABP1 family protein